MTEDDNSSWIFANSSFEGKHWNKVRVADDDAKSSTGVVSTDSEGPIAEGTSVTSPTDAPRGVTGAPKALNISSDENMNSTTVNGDDATDSAVEVAEKALNVSDSATIESVAETAGKVLNIGGNATTDSRTTNGVSEEDVTKSTEMAILEYDTPHMLNTRGSAGNTTDIMDILSDPDRKKWPTESERVEGESPQEPVRRKAIDKN